MTYTRLNPSYPVPISKGGTGATSATEARKALNAMACGNQAEMNASLSSLTTAQQIWAIWANCVNEANTARNGHRCAILLREDGLALYDSEGGGTQWTVEGTRTTVTDASAIFTPASGITVTNAEFVKRNGVAQLTVVFKGASGTGLQTIGTVASGMRPASRALGSITSTYATYADLTSAGQLRVYWNTAPGASSTYVAGFTYLLA